MWDQLCFTLKCKGFSRIIPTYVGSTLFHADVQRLFSNHSHVCGINFFIQCSKKGTIESFPRMWDQHADEKHSIPRIRIIPTYVGSTESNGIPYIHMTNHSHVCGINGPSESEKPISNESFPRMWDQQLKRITKFDSIRIIPTYVGSTHSI